MKIKWYSKGDNLNEIYQVYGLRYSFLSKDNEQCHAFAKCRDYLHDIIRTNLTGDETRIYGMHYTEDDPPIDLDSTKMLLNVKTFDLDHKAKDFDKYITCAIKMVQHYEDVVGEDHTKYEKIEGEKSFPHTYLISGPKFWMRSPFLISMYTYLLRLGYRGLEFKDAKDLDEKLKKLSKQDLLVQLSKNTDYKERDNDVEYIGACRGNMDTFLQNIDKVLEWNKDGMDKIYFQGTNMDTFHNRSGIYNLCKFNTGYKKINDKFLEICNKAKEKAKK